MDKSPFKCENADLHGRDLNGRNLVGATLTNANLAGVVDVARVVDEGVERFGVVAATHRLGLLSANDGVGPFTVLAQADLIGDSPGCWSTTHASSQGRTAGLK